MSSKKTLNALLVLFLLVIGPVWAVGALPAPEQKASAAAPVEISLQPFLSGLDEPVNLIANGVPGDERLFVVQRAGRILVVKPDGTLRGTPFLDISDRVEIGFARSGLYGLAFDPNYATNGFIYVHYIHHDGTTLRARLSRFQVSATNENLVDKATENILLTTDKAVAGHYAGDIQFGPDGYLYFPQGDGNATTVSDRPQSLLSMLGKMSRINVHVTAGEGAADCKGLGSGDYSIPLSNPFIGSATACDEIWANGLRNPWRFSFDKANGDLFLPDVGQMVWDELNFATAGTGAGRNYGWPCYEANQAFETANWAARGCDPGATFTFPIAVQAVTDDSDCSIIGGYVYRGNQFPDLVGHYLMSDFCSGRIRDAYYDGAQWVVTLHGVTAPMGVVSFGQGNNGELYVVNMMTNSIDRVLGEAGPPPAGSAGLLISSSANGQVQGVAYADEDILLFDPATSAWSLWFDGSDVGLTAVDIDALEVLADGRLLMSTDLPIRLPGVGKIDDSDLVLFAPTSLGSSTAGAYTMFLDGSGFELTTNGEDIDAAAFDSNGDLLISTIGTAKALGVTAADEDLIRVPLGTGGQPTAAWSLAFDGSDVALTNTTEDLGAAWLDPTDGRLWLATAGSFVVPGAKGNATDIFSCAAVVWGTTTACPGGFALQWQGASFGLSRGKIDALGYYAGE